MKSKSVTEYLTEQSKYSKDIAGANFHPAFSEDLIGIIAKANFAPKWVLSETETQTNFNSNWPQHFGFLSRYAAISDFPVRVGTIGFYRMSRSNIKDPSQDLATAVALWAGLGLKLSQTKNYQNVTVFNGNWTAENRLVRIYHWVTATEVRMAIMSVRPVYAKPVMIEGELIMRALLGADPKAAKVSWWSPFLDWLFQSQAAYAQEDVSDFVDELVKGLEKDKNSIVSYAKGFRQDVAAIAPAVDDAALAIREGSSSIDRLNDSFKVTNVVKLAFAAGAAGSVGAAAGSFAINAAQNGAQTFWHWLQQTLPQAKIQELEQTYKVTLPELIGYSNRRIALEKLLDAQSVILKAASGSEIKTVEEIREELAIRIADSKAHLANQNQLLDSAKSRKECLRGLERMKSDIAGLQVVLDLVNESKPSGQTSIKDVVCASMLNYLENYINVERQLYFAHVRLLSSFVASQIGVIRDREADREGMAKIRRLVNSCAQATGTETFKNACTEFGNSMSQLQFDSGTFDQLFGEYLGTANQGLQGMVGFVCKVQNPNQKTCPQDPLHHDKYVKNLRDKTEEFKTKCPQHTNQFEGLFFYPDQQ